MAFHLAHVNIAWMHGTVDEPVMSGFVRRIDEINSLAETHKGFVWRVPDSEASSVALEVFRSDFPGFDPSRFLFNMSVWETFEDLKDYSLFTAHAELISQRREWLDSIAGANVALWWIPAGQRPTVAEAADRLRSVRDNGPTPFAFILRKSFEPPESQR